MAHRYIDPFSGKSKSMRHASNEAYKLKLKRLYDVAGWRYYSPVAWSAYAPFDRANPGSPRAHADDAFLKRYYRSHYAQYARVTANRKVRRTRNVPQYSGYRKVYDFWWEIY